MTPDPSPDPRTRPDRPRREVRWERLGDWGSERASDAVNLVTVALVLLVLPGTGQLTDQLSSVGIGLGVVDLVGLFALVVGLLFCVAAGSAQLLGAAGRRLG